MTSRRRDTRDERGQTSLLVIGFFLVVLLVVVVVVDASAAYLRRQRLDALADGAAVAAADALAADRIYQGALGEEAPLDAAAARAEAVTYLRRMAAFRAHPGLSVRVRTVGTSVEVQVSAPLTLPFTPPGWDTSTRVRATAAAVVRVLDG